MRRASGDQNVEGYVGDITDYAADAVNRLTTVVQPSGYTDESWHGQDGQRACGWRSTRSEK
jgi:hypothetical protein